MPKKRKKKKSRRQLLQKELEELLKQCVRARDKDTCQRCEKLVYGSNSQTSHVIPKSQNTHLRYDLANVKLLCNYCHMHWWHGDNPIEPVNWFKAKFPGRYKYVIREHEKFKREHPGYIPVSWYDEQLEILTRALEEFNG